MGKFGETFLNWEVMAQYAPKVAEGFLVTIQLAAVIVVTGISVGLLLAVVRTLRFKPVNLIIVLTVDVLRALPALVLIMILYFALPTVGVRFSGFVATWLALAAILAAFAEEIFWAGILAVPRGQWEAARSTGLGFLQTLGHVVLPQAVRLTIPPLTNRTIAITKGTALGATVAVGEILYQAQTAYSFSYNPSPLTLGAIAYLLLFIPVVWLGRWVETRFAWKR
jgi:polar amino acid transport system permease protein